MAGTAFSQARLGGFLGTGAAQPVEATAADRLAQLADGSSPFGGHGRLLARL